MELCVQEKQKKHKGLFEDPLNKQRQVQLQYIHKKSLLSCKQVQGKKSEIFVLPLHQCAIDKVVKKNGQTLLPVISVNDPACVTYKLDSAAIIFPLNSLISITTTGLRQFRFPAAFKALSGSNLFIASRWLPLLVVTIDVKGKCFWTDEIRVMSLIGTY